MDDHEDMVADGIGPNTDDNEEVDEEFKLALEKAKATAERLAERGAIQKGKL